MTSIVLYNHTFYSREEMLADLAAKVDPVGITMILSAYEMASHVHEFQKRSDGTPYFWHISRVARILVRELEYHNPDVICAALLHDVLEDSSIITAEVLHYNFSSYVSYIVEVLTKNIRLLGLSRELEDQQYVNRLSEASVDCKIVKFAERLDNYRCLEFGIKRNPFAYIEETELYYFPMAERAPHPQLETLMRAMRAVKGTLFT